MRNGEINTTPIDIYICMHVYEVGGALSFLSVRMHVGDIFVYCCVVGTCVFACMQHFTAGLKDPSRTHTSFGKIQHPSNSWHAAVVLDMWRT